MWPWGEPQDVAHHGVDVHVVHGAVAVATPERGAVRGQERVHAGQGVVIAVVPHCSGAEHTVTVTASAAEPLFPSPSAPTPKACVLTKGNAQQLLDQPQKEATVPSLFPKPHRSFPILAFTNGSPSH